MPLTPLTYHKSHGVLLHFQGTATNKSLTGYIIKEAILSQVMLRIDTRFYPHGLVLDSSKMHANYSRGTPWTEIKATMTGFTDIVYIGRQDIDRVRTLRVPRYFMTSCLGHRRLWWYSHQSYTIRLLPRPTTTHKMAPNHMLLTYEPSNQIKTT